MRLANLLERHSPCDWNRQRACRDGSCERCEALRIRMGQMGVHRETALLRSLRYPDPYRAPAP